MHGSLRKRIVRHSHPHSHPTYVCDYIDFTVLTILLIAIVFTFYWVVFAEMSATWFKVSVNVVPNCVLASSPNEVKFGTFPMPYWGKTKTSKSLTHFSVSCTKGVYSTFSINEGEHALNHHRTMFDGKQGYLNYEVYTSSVESAVWDEKSIVTYKSTSASPHTITLYAYLSQGQDIKAGTYTDHLTVSMQIFPSNVIKIFSMPISIVFLPKGQQPAA